MEYPARRRKKKRHDGDRFILLEHGLLDSAAFKSLNSRAVRAMILLLRNWKMDGRGERFILPTHSTPGLDRRSATRALDELVKGGFFDCLDPGGYPNRPRIFKRSERWRAHSAALMADEAAGRLQGKLKIWTPTRRRRPAKRQPKLKLKATRPVATGSRPEGYSVKADLGAFEPGVRRSSKIPS